MPAAIGQTGPYAVPSSGPNLPGFNNFYLNQLPEAGFWNYLNKMGLTGNDPTARYAQNQQQRQYSNYLGQAGENPNLGFFDYLNQQHPDLVGQYNAQSPQQRFDFTSQTMTPRARWTFK